MHWVCTVLQHSQREKNGGRQIMEPAWITEMEVWQDLCGARVPRGKIDGQIHLYERLEDFKT